MFSFIFYFFHSLQLGKDVFGKSLTKLHIVPLSGNLLIESSFFMVLGIIFFIYFTPKSNFEFFKNLFKNYSRQIYIFFYVIFFGLLFSGRIFYDSFILFGIIFFLFSDFSFNYLSNLSYFREQKVNLRYFGLFLNYASSFISIYYIYNINFSVLLLFVLFFNLFFNHNIYKKYGNYASAFVYYVIIFLLLFFLVFRLYYVLLSLFSK
ncbi:hypothetical protein BLD25_00995 [Candidatus Gracilibacteria bacterium GN02-872]|nr:hypothetical protein BLD25_00995 [Candidatus Gracilibacteria bacterium GN02-872]